jgi:hypothetical protein
VARGELFFVRDGYLIVEQTLSGPRDRVFHVPLEYQLFHEDGSPVDWSGLREIRGTRTGNIIVVGDPHTDTNLDEFHIANDATSESKDFARGFQAALVDRIWHKEGSGKKYYANSQHWWSGYDEGHRAKRSTAQESRTIMAKPIPYDDDLPPEDDERDMRKIVLYDDEVLKLMQGWTGGESDPLYAISSTGGWNYAWVFSDAIVNIDRDLSRVKKLGRNKFQLGNGTFSKAEIDELAQIRDALQNALDDPESVMVDEARGAHARAPRAGRWSVEPGRHLFFNGEQAFRIASDDNDYRKVPHVAVDHAAHLIADLFNKNNVTIDSLYEGQMGHPRRRR